VKFFIDENIPKICSELLKNKGFEVIDIRGTKDEGISDKDIFNLSQINKSIFVTTDKDFFHTIPHKHKEHFGIIIFYLKQPNRFHINEKLNWF